MIALPSKKYYLLAVNGVFVCQYITLALQSTEKT